MTLLATLGWLSLVLIIAFTWAAGRSQVSRQAALIEAWINIAIGFGISYAMNWLLFPLVGAHISAGDNFSVGCIYTLSSILRTYLIRRWADENIHKASEWMAKYV